MSKISFIRSDDRLYNIERCLSLLKSEVIHGVKNAKMIVLKPTCPTDNNQLAATHVDALRALLSFIRPFAKGQIILAEGTSVGDTLRAFKNFGYLELQDPFDLALVDLNTDDAKELKLVDKDGNEMVGQIAKTMLQADFIISVSPPKTHDCVNFAGAIENITVGSLTRTNASLAKLFKPQQSSKALIRQGPAAMNHNIARIFHVLHPGLALVDAFEIMEGGGPVNGDLVAAHSAIASLDTLAADWLAVRLMGIDIQDIGYLPILGATNDADHYIVGDNWKENRLAIKMHPDFETNRLGR